MTRIVAVFCSLVRSAFRVGLDWWHETLHEDGSIGEKSAWKMYAGQQTVSGIVMDMVAACAGFDRGRATEQRVSHLLDYSVDMTGRFGFDPRSSLNALDVGYSPNDLQMPIATYPSAELLAVFGAASFFPQRLGEAGSLESTHGWRIGPPAAFVCGLWADPLPIALARIAASRSSSPHDVRLFSERAYRKNYSNLTLAKPSTITGRTP